VAAGGGASASSSRATVSAASAVIRIALATHQTQIASILNTSGYVRYAEKPQPMSAAPAAAVSAASPGTSSAARMAA
jgi:hypothetical protein